MKIIILGAGAIGSLVGALLSKDNDVLLIGRQEHVNEINKNGLEISGFINEDFKIKAETKINNIDDNTLIILTTKAVDNKKTLNNIKIKKNMVILCLQNGLGNEELIKKIVDCKVVRGLTTIACNFVEPSKVECSNIGGTYLEDSEVSENICNIFNRCGLKTEISKNIKQEIWKKLFINCAINPLTVIFKVKNGDLLRVQDLINPIVKELVIVSEKEGFKFNKEETFKTVIDVIENSSENISSMLQDILKGRKTEIDFLNGKIVELAEKHNVEVPVNRTLVSMIRFLENQ